MCRADRRPGLFWCARSILTTTRRHRSIRRFVRRCSRSWVRCMEIRPAYTMSGVRPALCSMTLATGWRKSSAADRAKSSLPAAAPRAIIWRSWAPHACSSTGAGTSLRPQLSTMPHFNASSIWRKKKVLRSHGSLWTAKAESVWQHCNRHCARTPSSSRSWPPTTRSVRSNQCVSWVHFAVRRAQSSTPTPSSGLAKSLLQTFISSTPTLSRSAPTNSMAQREQEYCLSAHRSGQIRFFLGVDMRMSVVPAQKT